MSDLADSPLCQDVKATHNLLQAYVQIAGIMDLIRETFDFPSHDPADAEWNNDVTRNFEKSSSSIHKFQSNMIAWLKRHKSACEAAEVHAEAEPFNKLTPTAYLSELLDTATKHATIGVDQKIVGGNRKCSDPDD